VRQTSSTSGNHRGLRQLLAFGLGVGVVLLNCHIAQAIGRDTIALLTTPLDPALFQPGASIDPTVITPDRVSQAGLTSPSLWWTEEQLNSLKWIGEPSGNSGCIAEQFGQALLNYWLAYPGTDGTPRRVDLLVNQDVWSDCNYLQRYVFVNKFGTAAKDFGYSVRVFNLQGELLGAHICEFNGPSAIRSPASSNVTIPCSIFLNPYGRSAFRGTPTPFGAPSPINGGTGLY
jgi:hypothetical protein